jgi:small redox-active disulfide protein 2
MTFLAAGMRDEKKKGEKAMKTLMICGPGCYNCKKLAENAEAAARELGIEYEIVKVTSINAITGFGVTKTPALLVDGEIKVSGKVPDVAEIKKILA